MEALVAILSALGGAVVGAVTAEALARRREHRDRARNEAKAIADGLTKANEEIALLRNTLAGLALRHDDLLRIVSHDEERTLP